jgi:hypothetical protein
MSESPNQEASNVGKRQSENGSLSEREEIPVKRKDTDSNGGTIETRQRNLETSTTTKELL